MKSAFTRFFSCFVAGDRKKKKHRKEVEKMEKVVTSKIDSLGRVLLPTDLREEMGMYEGCNVTISLDGKGLLVKRREPCCVICRAEVDEFKCNQVKDRFVCDDCSSSIEG